MNYETNFVATFEAAITFVLVKTSVTRVGKFCHFGKKLHAFGKFLIVYFLFGKILSHFGNFFDIIGLIFSVAHCQMLKNNLTILSHWSSPNLFMALVVEAETSDLRYKTFWRNLEAAKNKKVCSYAWTSTAKFQAMMIFKQNITQNCWPILAVFCFLKMVHSRPLFLNLIFSIQLTVIKVNKNYDNDRIWTADLWTRKRPLYQQSHNNFTQYYLAAFFQLRRKSRVPRQKFYNIDQSVVDVKNRSSKFRPF